jgi:hypothetical protein
MITPYNCRYSWSDLPLSWRRPVLTLSVIVAGVALLGVGVLDVLAINPDRPVGVIFAAATDPDTEFLAIAGAGGRPIRVGKSRLSSHCIWIVQADDRDFPARVQLSGAWLVINPLGVGGCLIASQRGAGMAGA